MPLKNCSLTHSLTLTYVWRILIVPLQTPLLPLPSLIHLQFTVFSLVVITKEHCYCNYAVVMSYVYLITVTHCDYKYSLSCSFSVFMNSFVPRCRHCALTSGIITDVLVPKCYPVYETTSEVGINKCQSAVCIHRLAVGRTQSTFGDRTFAAAASRLWNSLPPELRQPEIWTI